MTIEDRVGELVPKWREERARILEEKGDHILGECTVAAAFGGMRGLKSMICETSEVDANVGLSIRGHFLLDILDLWPEQTFLLLLTGEIEPLDGELVADFRRQMDVRARVPSYVFDVLRAMPKDSHPMAMLNTGILVMERESAFRAAYAEGMSKEDYWLPTLEDSLTLLARAPGVAAMAYRLKYDKGEPIAWTPGLDWGANFAKMLGIPDPSGDFAKLMRVFLHFHCDHEAGNVSANACHTVGSALSDAYYAVSAGLNGLAGPLHGLANQNVLSWLLETMERFGGAPTNEQIRDFAFETLRAGQVIPGYGHPVLRVTDPRFTGFLRFGQQHCADDPLFQTVNRIYETVPKVLEEYSAEREREGRGPIANFWPNVDAGSGALIYHYGLTEIAFYTVLFSVSRCMGLLSQLIWNRAVGTPITRPKSVSLKFLDKLA